MLSVRSCTALRLNEPPIWQEAGKYRMCTYPTLAHVNMCRLRLTSAAVYTAGSLGLLKATLIYSLSRVGLCLFLLSKQLLHI